MLQSDFSPRIFEMLAYSPLTYMLRAMVAGTAPAVCYADRKDEPRVCLVHEGHSLFVGGDALSPAADEAMDYLAHSLLTQELRRELHVMKIAFPDDMWKEKLKRALSGAALNEYMRSVYINRAPYKAAPCEVPEIEAITLDTAKLINFAMIRDEVESTLGSFDRFLKEAFGYALVVEGRVCGFCTSEYLSAGECAIGIEVLPEYQRKGYASRMTACLLGDCAARGLTPYWECWKYNMPSYKTAERSGFEKIMDYPVLFVEFGKDGA